MKPLMLFAGACTLAIFSCNSHKDDMPPPQATLPTVATAAATNVTATTATLGGTINSNGGGTITASGICWSRTHNVPTITDDTTKGNTSIGNFVSNLSNLNPNTTYFVRAYAISNAGVGYGSVVQFNTANVNAVPEARNVNITGTAQVAEILTSHYVYFDAESNPENGTHIQWYIANDSIGAPVTAIANATNATYTLAAADQNKFLRVGVTPGASTGGNPGVEVKSFWVGPVIAAAPTTVTFTYNGQTVTYGIITSATTGRKWLDRNLGAPNAPTAFNDWANYGDLFQWGRKADGHQLVNRGANTILTTAVNGTTTTLSTTADPGNALFILPSTNPFDWITPQSESLWKSTGGTNNACPVGWHVPTVPEWAAENFGTIQDAFAKLKITFGGGRSFSDGSFTLTTSDGLYWTSDEFDSSVGFFPFSFNFLSGGNAHSSSTNVGSMGFSVRCIKD